MRRLLYILLMVTILAGVFGSCRHTPGEAPGIYVRNGQKVVVE